MTIQRNLMGTGTPGIAAQAAVGILANSLTAAGSSQSDALKIPSDLAVFTIVAASTGTILPSSQPGDWYTVVNHGANTLTVYPPSGGKIANGSANAGFSVAATKTAQFQCLGSIDFAASLSA